MSRNSTDRGEDPEGGRCRRYRRSRGYIGGIRHGGKGGIGEIDV
jgi:hypothetical protein